VFLHVTAGIAGRLRTGHPIRLGAIGAVLSFILLAFAIAPHGKRSRKPGEKLLIAVMRCGGVISETPLVGATTKVSATGAANMRTFAQSACKPSGLNF
jgi:hypothetical protein